MSWLWELDGPGFLRVYVAAFVFALLFATAIRMAYRSGVRGAEAASGGLGWDELAYLAGGPGRVVELSVARLHERGVLRVSRGGMVQVVEGSAGVVSNPVDRAVVADVMRFGSRTPRLLVDQVGGERVVRAIGDALVRKGLLVGGRRRGGLSALPVVALLVVGGVRLVDGVAGGRPVGWLVLALLVTLFAVWRLSKPVSTRSYLGDRVLADAKAGRGGHGDAQLVTPISAGVATGDIALVTTGSAAVVAFGGLAAHPDSEVAVAMGESGGTSAGGSASSSCGGGSGCGGGGCGGCGGCGG